MTKMIAGAALLLALAGCGNNKANSTPQAVKPATEYFTIKVGNQSVRMQLAVQQSLNMQELERGLMGRTDLAEDQGMLFIYETPQRMGFYMRNTPTPLDIGFFTPQGALTEVRQMFPYDETTVLSARSDIQFALEMNQGWFTRHTVKADAKTTIDLKALAEALKARGFRPENYGIREEK